jgi:hypothetical protein
MKPKARLHNDGVMRFPLAVKHHVDLEDLCHLVISELLIRHGPNQLAVVLAFLTRRGIFAVARQSLESYGMTQALRETPEDATEEQLILARRILAGKFPELTKKG